MVLQLHWASFACSADIMPEKHAADAAGQGAHMGFRRFRSCTLLLKTAGSWRKYHMRLRSSGAGMPTRNFRLICLPAEL